MLNVALTFDYEIFFGENFASDDEILFFPTERLLKVLEKRNTRVTFFVDVLSVLMHEKYGLMSYCKKFVSQIQRMLQLGHDVQLHIHTNWLTAERCDDKWIFNTDNYRIHSYGFQQDNEISAYSIIKWGKDFLEKNLRVIQPDYKCNSYRAGGFCIQPHGELFKALAENEILIDSSVAVQQKQENIVAYDYTDIPLTRNGWWVNSQGVLGEQVSSDGDIYEVPVICTTRSLIRRILYPNVERTLRCEKPKGTYIGQKSTESVHNGRLSKLKTLLTYHKAKPMLTLDSLRYGMIQREIYKRAKKTTKTEYVAIIGHPKLIDDIWLNNLDVFLQGFEQENSIDFVTMAEIAKQIHR